VHPDLDPRKRILYQNSSKLNEKLSNLAPLRSISPYPEIRTTSRLKMKILKETSLASEK
jgi:hypothetical protein